MRCEDARAALSAAVDGEPAAAGLDEHVAGCAACAAYGVRLEDLRRALRFEVVDDVPDLVPAVMAGLRPRARPAWVALVAAVLAGALVGAVLVSGSRLGERAAPALADVGERVLAAQERVESLDLALDVAERGFAPDVPERRLVVAVRYQAPERLAVEVRDLTDYPTASWRPADGRFVVDADRWWVEGPAPCPRDALPDCASPVPRRQVVAGREPFADDLPAPLDLVVPVRSLAVGGAVPSLQEDEVAGRPVVGVRVTVAQLAPLLDGLRRAGSWRELYPGDEADVWLDRATLVPLRVVVRPAAGDDRELWAAARGFDDRPGRPVFEAEARLVAINEPVGDDAFPLPPTDAPARQAGFRDDLPAGVPLPSWLPDGMAEHRDGAGPSVGVATWTDGRAWVKVRATRSWSGGRLFGDLGDVVRPVPLPGGGTAYVAEGGARVGLHGDGVDVVVTGSLAPADLVRVAGSLGVRGLPVPAGWAEAGASTVADALGGLVPAGLDGFAPPAVRVADRTVTLSYTGGGDRGLVVVQAPGTRLAPPLEPDVRSVRVRGRTGRWSPEAGRLEWVEGGMVVEVRSRTLSLAELVAAAEGMEEA